MDVNHTWSITQYVYAYIFRCKGESGREQHHAWMFRLLFRVQLGQNLKEEKKLSQQLSSKARIAELKEVSVVSASPGDPV